MFGYAETADLAYADSCSASRARRRMSHPNKAKFISLEYLIMNVRVIPLGRFINKRMVFVPDFHQFRPILAGILEMVFCREDRESVEGGEI